MMNAKISRTVTCLLILSFCSLYCLASEAIDNRPPGEPVPDQFMPAEPKSQANLEQDRGRPREFNPGDVAPEKRLPEKSNPLIPQPPTGDPGGETNAREQQTVRPIQGELRPAEQKPVADMEKDMGRPREFEPEEVTNERYPKQPVYGVADDVLPTGHRPAPDPKADLSEMPVPVEKKPGDISKPLPSHWPDSDVEKVPMPKTVRDDINPPVEMVPGEVKGQTHSPNPLHHGNTDNHKNNDSPEAVMPVTKDKGNQRQFGPGEVTPSGQSGNYGTSSGGGFVPSPPKSPEPGIDPAIAAERERVSGATATGDPNTGKIEGRTMVIEKDRPKPGGAMEPDTTGKKVSQPVRAADREPVVNGPEGVHDPSSGVIDDRRLNTDQVTSSSGPPGKPGGSQGGVKLGPPGKPEVGSQGGPGMFGKDGGGSGNIGPGGTLGTDKKNKYTSGPETYGGGQSSQGQYPGSDGVNPIYKDKGGYGAKGGGSKGNKDSGNKGAKNSGNKGNKDSGNKGAKNSGNKGNKDSGNKGNQGKGNYKHSMSSDEQTATARGLKNYWDHKGEGEDDTGVTVETKYYGSKIYFIVSGGLSGIVEVAVYDQRTGTWDDRTPDDMPLKEGGNPKYDANFIRRQMKSTNSIEDAKKAGSSGGWVDPIENKEKDIEGSGRTMGDANADAVQGAGRNIGGVAGDSTKGHHVVDPSRDDQPTGGGSGMNVKGFDWIDPKPAEKLEKK